MSLLVCVISGAGVPQKKLVKKSPFVEMANFFRRTYFSLRNIRFSSLFAAADVSRGGTSATQRQKFHTDDAIQRLHNKSSSHGVPNKNLFDFTCLLVDFGKLLCSSANELQQNSRASSREDYISTNIDCFV